MKVQDLVVQLAKVRGVDEVLVVYPTKIEVKEWVAERATCREKRCVCSLPTERVRNILKEYTSCAFILGSKKEGFDEVLADIEAELHKIGHYKAWAIHNEKMTADAPATHEWFNIDIIGTLRRYKKNLPTPQPGEYPPWGIMLLE